MYMRNYIYIIIYMANLMNYKKPSHIKYLTSFGQKAKHLVELGVGIKGAIDTARTAYSLGQAAIPYVLPLLGVL